MVNNSHSRCEVSDSRSGMWFSHSKGEVNKAILRVWLIIAILCVRLVIAVLWVWLVIAVLGCGLAILGVRLIKVNLEVNKYTKLFL